MKELALPKAQPKFDDIEDIFNDEQKKILLTNYIDETIKSKLAIAAEQLNVKMLREKACDDLRLDPRLFNEYVATVYNNDYTGRAKRADRVAALLSLLITEAGLTYEPTE